MNRKLSEASLIARDFGFSSLAQVAELVEMTSESLRALQKRKPVMFKTLLIGALQSPHYDECRVDTEKLFNMDLVDDDVRRITGVY